MAQPNAKLVIKQCKFDAEGFASTGSDSLLYIFVQAVSNDDEQQTHDDHSQHL